MVLKPLALLVIVTVATGAFVWVQGAIYQVETGVTAGTSLTLDREFQGDTVSIDVSATTDEAGTVATVTSYGIQFTAKDFGKHFRVSRQGVLENADITYTTAYNPGSGTYADILAIEKEFESYSKGFWGKEYGFTKDPGRFAVSGETYDKYYIEFLNVADGKDVKDMQVGNPQRIICAFPDDNNGSNEGATYFRNRYEYHSFWSW